MRALLAALALVPLALLARQQGVAATTACHSTLSSGAHTVQIMVGSVQRSALVHVPARLPAGARVPVLIALHGWGGSGPRMETYSGFSKLADRHGFLAAYPSSSGTHWNYKAIRGGPDDVGFLRSLILYLRQRACADPQRVFAAGVSNGGGMVALAGCRLASLIAAIAPVAGDYAGQPACTPSRPLSVLEIHGTADPEAPYFGRGGHRTRDGVPPFVNGWVVRDGCSGNSSSRNRPAHDPDPLGILHRRSAGRAHPDPGRAAPVAGRDPPGSGTGLDDLRVVHDLALLLGRRRHPAPVVLQWWSGAGRVEGSRAQPAGGSPARDDGGRDRALRRIRSQRLIRTNAAAGRAAQPAG